MATQPIDRMKAKNHMKVDKRKAPTMVVRSNKTVMPHHLVPYFVAIGSKHSHVFYPVWYAQEWWK